MPTRPPHIICFAPYTDWSIHSARQVTILRALRMRGCSVTYLACDGAFSDCDLLQAANGAPPAKPANACLFCQARVASRLAGWEMPFRWLGQWLMTSDRQEAANWVNSLPPREYLNADFKTWPVGTWVKSSVHKHLRQNVLNFDDAATASVFASYLYSGVLASIALDRVFTEERPDAQLLFNGRMGVTRAALELGRLHGIRTICEERGYAPGRLMLFENANCLNYEGLKHLWSMWSEVVLSTVETTELQNFLVNRWMGRDGDISVFSSRLGSSSNVLESLGLDPSKPSWVLFTSSLDEAADLDTTNDVFASQYEWIATTLDFVRAHAGVQLVIRVHPNAGSKKSLGRNNQDLDYFESLQQNLPTNARIVSSTSTLGSYDLAMAADLGLMWRSTIGLEMSAMGRSVVRVGSGPLETADFINAPRTPTDYLSLLGQRADQKTMHDIQLAARAWRFAYVFFFRWSFGFPLVHQPKWYAGEMAYEKLDALAPGRDKALDHICDVFTKKQPLLLGPDSHDSQNAALECHNIEKALGQLRAKLAL
jgi:hypothetical protein